ncbi:MAG: dephospho-CoA kinase [Ignavibacteriae bacterium]|nr:dephospho-CoA kinase [Ignavibacteriota bacterium]
METKHQPHTLLVIGLTGNIGSGKSEVARMFEQLGAKVISADALAKDLMVSDTSVRKTIREEFGEESYLSDGSINRSFLAKKVFADTQQLKLLNSIVHPAVIQSIEKQISREEKTGTYSLFIVEAALIFEAGIENMFEYLIVVVADEEDCIRRVMKRDNSSREEVMKRMKSQIDQKRKAGKVDFVIHNIGTMKELKGKVEFVYQLLNMVK